jgi:hypothetical protein
MEADQDHGLRSSRERCQRRSLQQGGEKLMPHPLPLTWFVTFEIRKRGLLRKKERSPHKSHTFATEAEAKMFAQTKLEEGLVVFAGTINPHSPKRVVLSRDIAGWLVEGNEPLSPKDQPD